MTGLCTLEVGEMFLGAEFVLHYISVMISLTVILRICHSRVFPFSTAPNLLLFLFPQLLSLVMDYKVPTLPINV